MTYRPGRYRAGGRHEGKEEVNRRRALRYGGQGRKKEEVRIPSDLGLDFGERRKRTSWRSSERREIRESRIELRQKTGNFLTTRRRYEITSQFFLWRILCCHVLSWALSGASVEM